MEKITCQKCNKNYNIEDLIKVFYNMEYYSFICLECFYTYKDAKEIFFCEQCKSWYFSQDIEFLERYQLCHYCHHYLGICERCNGVVYEFNGALIKENDDVKCYHHRCL